MKRLGAPSAATTEKAPAEPPAQVGCVLCTEAGGAEFVIFHSPPACEGRPRYGAAEVSFGVNTAVGGTL
jgi:hypothetical protein